MKNCNAIRELVEWRRLTALFCTGLWLWTNAAAQRVYILEPSEKSIVLESVSASGMAAGYEVLEQDAQLGFRWTFQGGFENIGNLGRATIEVRAISSDGRVIVGWSQNSAGQQRAFRWEEGVGMEDLGTLPGGNFSIAHDVSADGSVVVGESSATGFSARPFRWTRSRGMIDLGALRNSVGRAFGVSLNGEIVVGNSRVGTFQFNPFRWRLATGTMENLGNLSDRSHRALSVSADGNVVVGEAVVIQSGSSRTVAFRWTPSTGLERLGTLGGPSASANSVSADGRTIVGYSSVGDTISAFVWTEERGMEDLNDLFSDFIPQGVVLSEARDISVDGRYIVGRAFRPEVPDQILGFWLDTWREGDTNGDGCIDDNDLLSVLFAFGTPGTGMTRHEDINKDGIVDDSDLLTVLFNFGQGC